MKKNMKKLLFIATTLFVLLGSYIFVGLTKEQEISQKDKLQVVATTTFLGDLLQQIGGDKIDLVTLMGPGIYPHQFQASSSDLNTLLHADIIFFGGLHLEAKLAEIFEKMEDGAITTIDTSRNIPKNKLHGWEDDEAPDQVYDPHVWFDIDLWQIVADDVTATLQEMDSKHAAYYGENRRAYGEELSQLATYVTKRVNELPSNKQFLVTAHDAFNYFGTYTGMDVRGIQGFNTVVEAGTSDVSSIAQFIVDNEIKAIFVESTVSPKLIQALQEAVRAKGFDVQIGGELYSDSAGDAGSYEGTYIGMYYHNVDTIIDALKE